MKKINFPLNLKMKREMVADLHNVLSFLKFAIDKKEINKKYFGKTTWDAVKKFQQKHGLTVNGKVDEATANKLNELIKEKVTSKKTGISKSSRKRRQYMNDKNGQIDFDSVREICSLIKIEVGNVIVGYEDVVDDLMVCLIAKGHILLEGVPGIAKTTLAKTFSKITGLVYNRIQFTPDLLPSDISGHYYFNQKENTFDLRKGPLFNELVLADEINRTSPKTQSALLEAMQERQITIEGNTFNLPDIFMVIATLNPIETEGIYHLPEAQLDRFMYKVKMDYISEDEELQMLYRKSHTSNVSTKPVEDGFIDRLVACYENVYVDKSILKYIRDIIIETRNKKELVLGASPRAGEQMLYAAKAYSLIHGSDYVIPDHVKAIVHKVLNHKLLLSIESELEGITVEKIIDDVLDNVEVPKGREKT